MNILLISRHPIYRVDIQDTLHIRGRHGNTIIVLHNLDPDEDHHWQPLKWEKDILPRTRYHSYEFDRVVLFASFPGKTSPIHGADLARIGSGTTHYVFSPAIEDISGAKSGEEVRQGLLESVGHGRAKWEYAPVGDTQGRVRMGQIYNQYVLGPDYVAEGK